MWLTKFQPKGTPSIVLCLEFLWNRFCYRCIESRSDFDMIYLINFSYIFHCQNKYLRCLAHFTCSKYHIYMYIYPSFIEQKYIAILDFMKTYIHCNFFHPLLTWKIGNVRCQSSTFLSLTFYIRDIKNIYFIFK